MWDFKRGDFIKARTKYRKQITVGATYKVEYVHLYHIIIKDNNEQIEEYPKIWFEYDVIKNRDNRIDDILK